MYPDRAESTQESAGNLASLRAEDSPMSTYLPVSLDELTPEKVAGNRPQAFRNLDKIGDPESLQRMDGRTVADYARAIVRPLVLDAFVPGLTMSRLADLMVKGNKSHLSQLHRGTHPVASPTTLFKIVAALKRARDQYERGEFVPGDPRGRWERKPVEQGSP